MITISGKTTIMRKMRLKDPRTYYEFDFENLKVKLNSLSSFHIFTLYNEKSSLFNPQ